ncbi:bifunctional precorrin-2 dehydrogenase/sirohydrochlorin ferrochelatase [Deinococcus sp.]|uniref:precorrin-2 dehydrogenase/sirohydrochlorin ferrochelatase family protein n=1 Tax=Deinococcus sp. TaxID=47478 RepID=UPI0025FE70B7|nr:bifunctional precorrin-2 dehydrogenase/sirohydrochlorin ferrochelatase [Deinococcus sp.]
MALNLAGETALIVGGGEVALRRATTLSAAGLRLRVVALDVNAALSELTGDIQRRPFETADLDGARLVVACTSSMALNDEVTRLARLRGLLVNHAGAAEAGTLRFPALIERGGLSVAISTGTELPMLAQALREKLGAALPESLPMNDWSAQRDAALQLAGSERAAALDHLRVQIRAGVGL